MCQAAVSRIPLSSSYMATHMRLHKVRGHLELLQTYPHPIVVDITAGNNLTQEDEIVEDFMVEDGMIEDGMMIEDQVIEYFPADQILCVEHRKRIRESNESFKSMSP
jgi:hypothetical protein